MSSNWSSELGSSCWKLCVRASLVIDNADIDQPRIFFRLPPNEEGEWWELSDESRGGLPYYYQTKSGETVWERPEGFVIPLGIIQVRFRL